MPRRIILNPLAVAAEGAARLPEAQRETIKGGNSAALGALRRGDAVERHMTRLSHALLMADALARIAPLARGNRDHEIAAGIDALAAVTLRRATLGHYTARGPELTAIGDALAVHHTQLDAASVLEWERAQARVDAQARSKFGRKAA